MTSSNPYSKIYLDPKNFDASLHERIMKINNNNSQYNADVKKSSIPQYASSSTPAISSGKTMTHTYYSSSDTIVRSIIG